jgi:hypothetical protein
MERNTLTTLGQLQDGDRFTFPTHNKVWQVTGRFGKSICYNQFNDAGQQLLKYHLVKNGAVAVRFLRHTNTTEVKS